MLYLALLERAGNSLLSLLKLIKIDLVLIVPLFHRYKSSNMYFKLLAGMLQNTQDCKVTVHVLYCTIHGTMCYTWACGRYCIYNVA